MSGGTRIDFVSVDAARFNALRDQWRGAAASCALSRSGLRVATVLPTFINREFGYAFPTDEDLAGAMTSSTDTAKRGLGALEHAELIERKTTVKRDEKGEALGRARRIYLTLPRHVISREGNGPRPEVKAQTAPEVKVQEVKVHREVKGQKRRGEGAYGCTNIPDRTTPDLKNSPGENPVSSHVHARDLTLHLPPDPDPSPAHSHIEDVAPSPRVVRSPRPNPIPTPASWGDDIEFLSAFDEAVIDLTRGKEIGAGEIERIVQTAFDRATDSRDDFMPVHWRDLLACRTNQTVEWFRYRASGLIHQSEAA